MAGPLVAVLAAGILVCLTGLLWRLTRLLLDHGGIWFLSGQMVASTVPQMAVIALPAALLVAVVLVTGRMAATNEILALGSCGVGPVHVLMPMLAVCAAAGGLAFWAYRGFVPTQNLLSSDLSTQIQFTLLSDIRPGQLFELEMGGDESFSILYDIRDPATEDMKGVAVRTAGGMPLPGDKAPVDSAGQGDQTGREPTLIVAAVGRVTADMEERRVVLVLTSGTLQLGRASGIAGVRFGDLRKSVRPLFPRTQTGAFLRSPREMSLSELRAVMRDPPTRRIPKRWMTTDEVRKIMAEPPRPNHAFSVEYYLRMSLPLACVALALAGFPLALRWRPASWTAAVTLSLALVGAYFVVVSAGISLGGVGHPAGPWVIFLPNVLAAAGGVAMIRSFSRPR